MKGNQGLEALAALCGGRPKADSSGVIALAVATSNTSGTGASPHNQSPSPVAGAEATKHMLMRQAAERNAAEAASLVSPSSCGNGSVPIHQHQHPVAASAPISTDSLAAPGLGLGNLSNLTPQQISQAIVAAANSQGGRFDPALAQSLLYPSVLRGSACGVESVAAATPIPAVSPSNNNILANTMQQLVIQQYLQAQANAQQQVQQQQQAQAQAAATAAATSGNPQAALLAMTLAAGKAGQQQQHFLPSAAPAPTTSNTTSIGGASDQHRSNHASSGAQQQQVQAQTQALLQHAAQQQQQLNTAGFTSIKPASTGIHQHAQAIQQQYHFPNSTTATTGVGANANLPSMMKIAAAGGRILPSSDLSSQNPATVRAGIAMKDGANANLVVGSPPGGKKQQKRAANRRSAQLSRKRKKQFIEELKDENDDLRRKEQILRAIPDLIVVFDSSGRLGFVSESVGRFLDVNPEKLEGTSFWDLICEESVRMLKAAFMDSLAARVAESDTAVLGSGVWEIRLKNKHSKYMNVSLNGVVHFKGDSPECVCCIRPLADEQQQVQHEVQQQKQSSTSKQQPKITGESGDPANNIKRAVSCSDGDASRSSYGSNGTQQSVLTSHHAGVPMSSVEQDEAANDAKKRNKKFRRVMASAEDIMDVNKNNNIRVECDGTNNSVRISDGDDSNDGIESD